MIKTHSQWTIKISTHNTTLSVRLRASGCGLESCCRQKDNRESLTRTLIALKLDIVNGICCRRIYMGGK